MAASRLIRPRIRLRPFGVAPAGKRLDTRYVAGELVYVEGRIEFTIDLAVYRLSAIKKAAYRLADRCTAMIGAGVEAVPVALIFRTSVAEAEAREVAQLFWQELLDQELREQVADETASLRSLILAHAFSRSGVIKGE